VKDEIQLKKYFEFIAIVSQRVYSGKSSIRIPLPARKL
jgi:hypothetical protein